MRNQKGTEATNGIKRLLSLGHLSFRIGGFHVTSSPPCWWTVNKRSLISSLCLSTSICSFHHCYLCLPRLHENHLYDRNNKVWLNHWLRGQYESSWDVFHESFPRSVNARVVLRKKNTSAVPRLEKGRRYKGYLREHPVFSALVASFAHSVLFTSWFHIRIYNRQSLKYYRLSETSWKIHENIALWFNNKSQGFLLMLVESFKPENFPSFPQRVFRYIFPRVCARSTQKLARYFFEYARWIVIGH